MNRRDLLRSMAALGALGVAGCGKNPTPEIHSVPVDTDTLDALFDALAPYDWAALVKQVPGELEALRLALVELGMGACADSVSGFGNEALPGVLELLETLQTADEATANAALNATVQRIGTAAAALDLGQIEAELAAQGWDQGIGGDDGVDVMDQTEVDVRTVIVQQELHENSLANLALLQLRRDRQWVTEGCVLGDTLDDLDVAQDRVNSWTWPTTGPVPPLPEDPLDDFCAYFGGVGLIQMGAEAIDDDPCGELRSALERSAYVLAMILTWVSLLTLLIKGTMFFGLISVVGAMFALVTIVMMLYVMSSTICRVKALTEAIAECES